MPPHRSLWLKEALPQDDARTQFAGDGAADVAIIGGGYVGLWTALRIKELEPGCDVAVLERDVCGGGASGRNGGFVLSWWPKFPSLIKACGEAEALRLAEASADAIGRIGAFCDANGIDAAFVQRGWLWTATSTAQMGAWERVVSECERRGIDAFRRLTPDDVARRTGSAAHKAGVLERCAATVQPASLARGLRAAAMKRGVHVYEESPVIDFERAQPSIVRTKRGSLKAARVIVATNAWAAALPELARSIVVISSDIVATQPMPERLAAIGWTGGESIADSQMMVCYYRTTADGRIAFGKGGWGVAYGARIGANLDRDAQRAVLVENDFRRYYPMLSDVAITDDWCGPIDRSPDGLPLIGRLGGRSNIFYGVGWSGNGVGPSFIGGQILASLALGRADEWSQCGLVDRPHAQFPPEPIRYVGARLVRSAVMRKERAENEERKPPWLAAQLAKLAPAGIEDKG